MKTIFQTGFRPANPFAMGINPFGSIRLGQYEDEGWPEEVPDPSTYEQPAPTYTYEQPVESEEDEWRSLQQYTTPTSTTPKKPSVLEQIAAGIATGGTAAAAAYAKAEAEKAKREGITTKPGMVPTITPGAGAPSAGISSTTLLVGLGAAALVAIVAVAVA